MVVGDWQLYEMRPPAEAQRGMHLKVDEAETDEHGLYLIPEWGPRPRPPWGWLDYAPKMIFFKNGYYPISAYNKRESDTMIRTSDFDGQIVRLKKFDGQFKHVSDALFMAKPHFSGCWRDCPRYVLAFDAEIKRLQSIAPPGPPFYFASFVPLERLAPDERAYFERFRQ